MADSPGTSASRWPSRHVLAMTLPVHALGFALLFFIVATKGLRASDAGLFLLGWIMISGLGIAIGYHRLLCHAAFPASTGLRRALAYLGCLGAQGSPQFWVAIHNGLHHRYADEPADIHSPRHGAFHAYVGWQMKLRVEQVPFRFALSMQRDPVLKFMHKHYLKLVWGTVAFAASLDLEAATFLLLLPMIVSIHQENMVNWLGHRPGFGYRNFEITDLSRNHFVLGVLTFGQGFHNNHHAEPTRFDFGSERWFEWDPSATLVRGLLWMDRRWFARVGGDAELLE